MANEVKNLKQEIDEWITQKDDAVEIVVLLMSKFEITPQNFIDRLNEVYASYRRKSR